ncbi:MAG TPA: DUF3570 domain-containing protein [Polyangia bacterium]|nr:DUF3570 domain-containing protein [Polyangia bacterium]
MRLQLTRSWRRRLPLVVALAGAALAVPARAADNPTEASARFTFFQEPSKENGGIKVIHPQVDASSPLGAGVGIAAGWAADAVTGATPAVFGPHVGVDAITTATQFHDLRQQAHGALSYDRPDAGIAASYAYGWEHDYRSHSLSVTTRDDLYDHNFTLGLSYTHNWDSVCDANNAAATTPLDLHPLTSSEHCFTAGAADVVSRRLSIDAVEPSLSWTMTPRLVVQGGGTIQLLDGFQSNPYRRVLVGSQRQEPQEHEPTYRQRYAVFARAAYAFPQWRASALAMGRLYQDSWAMQAVTGDLQVNKYLSQWALLTLRGHYHLQSGASFYRDGQGYRVNGPAGQYWTGDRELSPMSNYLIGGRVAFLRRPQQERSSWFAEMEADVKYELLMYHLDSVNAPNADRPYAHILQAAFAVRF